MIIEVPNQSIGQNHARMQYVCFWPKEEYSTNITSNYFSIREAVEKITVPDSEATDTDDIGDPATIKS